MSRKVDECKPLASTSPPDVRAHYAVTEHAHLHRGRRGVWVGAGAGWFEWIASIFCRLKARKWTIQSHRRPRPRRLVEMWAVCKSKPVLEASFEKPLLKLRSNFRNLEGCRADV